LIKFKKGIKLSAKKIIISGGGSGGHIFPAISIANALKQIDSNIDILFIGALGKIEMEKVPKAGYLIEGLWISGFHRKKLWRNILFPIKLLSSLLKARRIIKRFNPDVVVGVGGFASGPTLRIASGMKIPTLIQEQNSYAGMTNRLLASSVDKVCVAYPEMENTFPAEKIIFTGNPVRLSILDLKASRDMAAKHNGFDSTKPIVLLIGGSLGASSLNKVMAKNTAFFENHLEVQILWQCGSLYLEEYENCATAQLKNVKVTAFIDRMDLAYSMSDVIIARAGAGTIAELMVVAKPVILVPSPNVAEDHQTYNANALVKEEAALMVADKDIEQGLFPTLIELLSDDQVKAKMELKLKSLAITDAAERISKEVLKLADQKVRL